MRPDPIARDASGAAAGLLLSCCRRNFRWPGMRKDVSANSPDMNAARMSSTGPQICGITSTPADCSRFLSSHEMAPQISTSTPSPATRRARDTSSASLRECSAHRSSRAFSTSTRTRCCAVSNSGEILFSNVGIAAFMSGDFVQGGCWLASTSRASGTPSALRRCKRRAQSWQTALPATEAPLE